MIENKIEFWNKNSHTLKDYEDLFFSLIECKEKNFIVSKDTLIKTFKILIKDLIEQEYLNKFPNYSNKKYYSIKTTENILDCLDIIFSLNFNKAYVDNKSLYLIYKMGGEKILVKYNFNLESKSFLTHKLVCIFSNELSEANQTQNKTIEWYNQFLSKIVKHSENADKNVIIKNSSYSVLSFAAAVELGHEPSQKEILKVFSLMWNKLTLNKKIELDYFCDAFSKTNVFKNTLAPTKNLQNSLRNFFKDLLINFDKFEVPYQKIYLHEDKLYRLYNNPAFLHEHLKRQILKKESEKYLGKSIFNKEEEEIIFEHINKKSSVKKNKI